MPHARAWSLASLGALCACAQVADLEDYGVALDATTDAADSTVDSARDGAVHDASLDSGADALDEPDTALYDAADESSCVSLGKPCDGAVACCGSCASTFECTASCGQSSAACDAQVDCCLGSYCAIVATHACEACLAKNASPCAGDYQCCSHSCANSIPRHCN